jgi:hypothetical protein
LDDLVIINERFVDSGLGPKLVAAETIEPSGTYQRFIPVSECLPVAIRKEYL